MADLLQLLTSEDDDTAASTGRLVDIMQGLCGGECGDGELVLMGTGEVFKFRNLNQPHDDVENVDSATSYEAIFRSASILMIAVALSTAGLLLLVFISSFVWHRLKTKTNDPNERDSFEHSSGEDVEEKTEDHKGVPATPDAILPVPSSLETDATAEVLLGSHGICRSEQSWQSCPTMAGIDVNCTSTLQQYSESDYKMYGQEIARSMTLFMSEFETTMKHHGYTVSPTDSLTIASQQLLSLTSSRIAQTREARQYWYDAQQRNVDRSLAERRHAETLQAQEQDREWHPKLLAARDNCIRGILPSIQGSLFALGLCYVAYCFYKFRDLFSLHTVGQIMWHSIYKIQDYFGTHGVWMQNNAQQDDIKLPTASVFSMFEIMSRVVHFLSRLWVFLVFPTMAVGCYFVAQLLLPTMVMDFGKTAVMGWLFVCVVSTAIPWKGLCICQLAFGALANIWTRLLFAWSFRELNRLESCPTSKDLSIHLSWFDLTVQSLTVLACILNGIIIALWSMPSTQLKT